MNNLQQQLKESEEILKEFRKKHPVMYWIIHVINKFRPKYWFWHYQLRKTEIQILYYEIGNKYLKWKYNRLKYSNDRLNNRLNRLKGQ